MRAIRPGVHTSLAVVGVLVLVGCGGKNLEKQVPGSYVGKYVLDAKALPQLDSSPSGPDLRAHLTDAHMTLEIHPDKSFTLEETAGGHKASSGGTWEYVRGEVVITPDSYDVDGKPLAPLKQMRLKPLEAGTLSGEPNLPGAAKVSRVMFTKPEE